VSDDGEADTVDIRTVLDRNERTLKHLTLGGAADDPSWDYVFESVTINNLTHLDLIDINVSEFMLTRIANAHNLQSLTLHAFEDMNSAISVFASDRIIDGTHTLFPYLEAFRFQDDDNDGALYDSVIHFLQKRDKLRRLGLGDCPTDKVQAILPDLRNLRVLWVHIDSLSQVVINTLVESIPVQMVAISLAIRDTEFIKLVHTLPYLM
jgi:hypothetical protein